MYWMFESYFYVITWTVSNKIFNSFKLPFSSSSLCWTTARGCSPCSPSTRPSTLPDGSAERSTTSSSCLTASFRSLSSSRRNTFRWWPTLTSESSSSLDHGISGDLWPNWSWHQRESRKSRRKQKPSKRRSNRKECQEWKSQRKCKNIRQFCASQTMSII